MCSTGAIFGSILYNARGVGAVTGVGEAFELGFLELGGFRGAWNRLRSVDDRFIRPIHFY